MRVASAQTTIQLETEICVSMLIGCYIEGGRATGLTESTESDSKQDEALGSTANLNLKAALKTWKFKEILGVGEFSHRKMQTRSLRLQIFGTDDHTQPQIFDIAENVGT